VLREALTDSRVLVQEAAEQGLQDLATSEEADETLLGAALEMSRTAENPSTA
jgi:hypothetical protein